MDWGWWSWGSPVGLGMFLVGAGVVLWGLSRFLPAVSKTDKEEQE